ncbi:glycosyltransferase family 2 protein [Xylanibacter rodentium]|uniref:glycosyltransferase family 2 protein n=1 Tax=Xylanibacter rodentium TaxID=2736289 RepID=UPI0025B35A4D
MTNELISIIIPLYNKEKAISQTLMSVLNQTYNNLEIIIADDGSTDNSASIVKKDRFGIWTNQIFS